MFSHGAIPRSDPFSFTAFGTPWVDSYWLYEIFLYAGERLAGLGWIILLKTLCVAGALVAMDKRLRERGLPWPARLAAQALVLVASQPRGAGWTENASTLSFLFFSILLWRRERWRRGEPPPGVLPGLLFFALWANLHRGFVLGLAVLGLDLIEKVPRAGAPKWKEAGFIALGGLATLATPYGIGLYRVIADDFILSPAHTNNWFGPPLSRFAPFWCVLAIFWASRIWKITAPAGRARPLQEEGKGGREWLAPLFLSWLAARHAWAVRFFMLEACGELAAAVWEGVKDHRGGRLGRIIAGEGPWTAAAAFALIVSAVSLQPARAGVDLDRVPVAACGFIAQNKVSGPFYNAYGFGGYWIWRFNGDPPVFIDGRYPSVRGYIRVLDRFWAAKQGNPGAWGRFLDSYGARAALVGYPAPSVKNPPALDRYFPRSRWALVYWDDTALLFVRRDARHRDLIRRWEFREVSPNADPAEIERRWRSSPAAKARIREELLANLAIHPRSWRTARLVNRLAPLETRR
jgi:hypothetical protein